MMRAAIVILCAACASPNVPSVRFANTEAVDIVDDRRDVPTPPRERDYLKYFENVEAILHRPVSRALRLERSKRALGVNALDEVPDSTWFTNRIGVRSIGLDELRVGPATSGSPDDHKPWTIVRSKQSGAAAGFLVRDARGVAHLLKCDEKGLPELESGAAIIASKLFWAAGYHVPEDYLVHVHDHELVVGPDSIYADPLGNERRLERADVERELARCARGADGTYRGIASRIIDGKTLGGHPEEGLRRDDPNDRIPHERRRDLRGAYPIFAWLDHTDAKSANTLDVWVADRDDPTRHYVMHYLIDFGKSLGALPMASPNKRPGHVYAIDPVFMLRSFLTGGLGERPWDDRVTPNIRGVGLYGTATYDPGAWKPVTQRYLPFIVADDRDKLWGAKILARFTPEQLRAVVETARFTDPRATEYLVATLIARQRMTVRHWFERASPLDRFTVDDDRLCFDDLMLVYRLLPDDAERRYMLARHDRRGRPVGSKLALHAYPRTCVPLGLAPVRDGYTIFAIAIEGGPAIDVHVARDPRDHTPRVIGIWRR